MRIQGAETIVAAHPVLVQLLAHLPTPCLLVDENGAVLLKNESADEALADMPVTLFRNCLGFLSPLAQGDWQQALARVRATGLPGSFTVPAEGLSSWVLRIVPWNRLEGAADGCLVIVERKGGPTRRQILNFASMFNLSRAESEVLELLLAGRAAKEIARARESSVNTVRSQICQVLSKTGARSIRELVARPVDSPAQVRESPVTAGNGWARRAQASIGAMAGSPLSMALR